MAKYLNTNKLHEKKHKPYLEIDGFCFCKIYKTQKEDGINKLVRHNDIDVYIELETNEYDELLYLAPTGQKVTEEEAVAWVRRMIQSRKLAK